MPGWLVPIVGPLLGIGVARLVGLRRPVYVMIGALVGQLIAVTSYARLLSHELTQLEVNPPRDRDVAFLRFQPSLHQRLGAWMILAGVALAISAVVLLVQRDEPRPDGP
jgi:hypothetical protein